MDVFAAAGAGNLERVRALVEQDAGLAHATDHNGWTPLLWAAEGGHVEVARYLLDHGVTINLRGPGHTTALHQACFFSRGNYADVVTQLLEAGADPVLRTTDGRTAMNTAVMSGHQDCIAVLQEWDRAYLLQRSRSLRDASSTPCSNTPQQGS